MLHARALALITSVAAVGLAIPSAAAANAGPLEVFTYGQCVQAGFPAPSEGGSGPLIGIIGPQQGFFFHTPPGQFGNALIGCGVEPGPGE